MMLFGWSGSKAKGKTLRKIVLLAEGFKEWGEAYPVGIPRAQGKTLVELPMDAWKPGSGGRDGTDDLPMKDQIPFGSGGEERQGSRWKRYPVTFPPGPEAE